MTKHLDSISRIEAAIANNIVVYDSESKCPSGFFTKRLLAIIKTSVRRIANEKIIEWIVPDYSHFTEKVVNYTECSCTGFVLLWNGCQCGAVKNNRLVQWRCPIDLESNPFKNDVLDQDYKIRIFGINMINCNYTRRWIKYGGKLAPNCKYMMFGIMSSGEWVAGSY